MPELGGFFVSFKKRRLGLTTERQRHREDKSKECREKAQHAVESSLEFLDRIPDRIPDFFY